MYLARVRGHCIEAWLGSWRDTRFYVNDVGTVIYQLAEAFLEYFCKYYFPVFSHLLPIFHPSIRFGFPVPVTGKNWKLGEKWDFSQFPKKLGKLCLQLEMGSFRFGSPSLIDSDQQQTFITKYSDLNRIIVDAIRTYFFQQNKAPNFTILNKINYLIKCTACN